jgi:single-strand DNA-binding protein
MNKVFLIGNLGKDPDLRKIASGSDVCSFSVATNDHYTDKEGHEVEKTEWHNIVVWGKLAARCAQYLQTGSKVGIEGSLQTRNWDDTVHAGVKHYVTEIKATKIEFLSKTKTRISEPRDEDIPPPTEEPAAPVANKSYKNEDTLPF